MGSVIGGIGGMAGGSTGNFLSDNQGMLSPATLLGMNNPYKAGAANILNPSNMAQANAAYDHTQSGLGQQQSFLDALAAQHGIGNQSSVFNQMQGLTGQLQGMANGTGPNPAMAMLHSATGQNIASQAALMAGQRGASANAGLMARQAAQQGAGIQQQAVGQGAQMQAQQQMAALAALQQQQQMMGGLATQQVGQQAGALTGYNQFAQNQQSNILNGINGQNAANVNMMSNMNNVNSGVAGQNAQANQQVVGGVLNSAGKLGAMAHGGMAGRDGYAEGGTVQPQIQLDPEKVKQFMQGFGGHPTPAPKPQMFDDGGMAKPQSFVGQFLTGMNGSFAPKPVATTTQYDIGTAPKLDTADALKEFGSGGGGGKGGGGGGLGGLLGGMMASGGMMKQGGNVPGQAQVAGDSLQNDTVDAKLSPGEIVIPRHITMAPDAPKKAAAFVKATLARKKPRG